MTMKKRIACLLEIGVFLFAGGVMAAENEFADAVRKKIVQESEGLLTLYRDLHSAPELSFHEEKTGARIANELRSAGFDVTEKADLVGG